MISIRLYIDHEPIMTAKPYPAFEAFCKTFRFCSIDILKPDVVALRQNVKTVLKTFLHALF